DLNKGVLNGYGHYEKKNINDEPSSSLSTSRKRKRYKDKEIENSDLHSMEITTSPHENISIITKAMICNWESCGKTFRTRLALKAHVISEHMNEEILKVSVINT